MRESKNTTQTWLIILILVLIIVLYVASLGQVGGGIVKIPDQLSESRERARHRHRKLEECIKKQKELKKKLDRKFRRIYLGVRISLVLLWVGTMAILYFVGIINGVGDFLTYSQFSVLFVVTLNFLTFGSLSNVNEFIDSLKRRTENWVYGKYLDISERIETNEKEMDKLENEIKVFDQFLPNEASAPKSKNPKMESSDGTQ